VASSDGSYDVVIIGSGPGGYVAAVRAGQLGLKTAVVEMYRQPGGTCLHWGCIPTKALLHAAEVLDMTRHAGAFGVRVAEGTLDRDAVVKYKEKTVQANAKGVQYLLDKNEVELLAGRGRLAGPGRVEVTPEKGKPFTVTAANVVLATGSVVRGLPHVAQDGKHVIDSDDALELTKIPSSIVVLGAGAVGVEFASIYRSFGAEVTLVELLPRLVPIEDAELGAELERAFKKRGITVHTGTRVESVEIAGRRVRASARRGDERIALESETLLVAVGRRPRTEDLGLDGTRVAVDERGFVRVDEMMRTGEDGVYAIGDIVASPALAHVASHEGIVAVEHAAGLDPLPVDYDRVPSCTYCSPEVASVGLSEERARERGLDVKVGRFPFSAIGKAKILNDTRGFVKIVCDRRHDEVVGVHIVGPHATELIAEATAALNLEATAESLFHTIHAHPTLSEAMGEAALAVHDRPIHM
jgi:dihydrolipoamide dehydrogenase